MHAYLIEGNNSEIVEQKIVSLTKKENSIRIDFTLQKIEEVRNISSITKLAHNRSLVITLKDIDNISIEAANALLKTLEEPPHGITFILIARSIYSLPPTILSRCQIIKTKKTHDVSENDIKEFETFLLLPIGKKLAQVNMLSDRPSAREFLRKCIPTADYCLKRQEDKKTREKIAKFIFQADRALQAIDANGNVKLQLTNLFIKI